jgi:hypothetical protein
MAILVNIRQSLPADRVPGTFTVTIEEAAANGNENQRIVGH